MKRTLLAACLCLAALPRPMRADESDAAEAAAEAYETDRPGELENPYALPAGAAESVDYLAELSADARADEFGPGRSAALIASTLRFGVGGRVEGVVELDTLLPGGVGFARLLAKWNFLGGPASDFGLAIAPILRLPVNRTVAGSAGSSAGVIVPFHVDLEGGWDLEGSSSAIRGPGDDGDSEFQCENQVSLERTLFPNWTAYVELQVESGEGPPAWGLEFGATDLISSKVLLDLGASLGLGRAADEREIYAGVGWRL